MPPPSRDPLEIDAGGEIPGDPHQEHQHHAEGEGEAQVVVRILGPLRPVGEGCRPDQRGEQLLAEGDVEAGERQHDEARRRHPVHEPLEGVEAHQGAARAPGLDAHHAADQIEQDQHGKHAEDGDRPEPAQRHLVELAPVAPVRLLKNGRACIGKRAAALDFLQLLQELLLLDRLRGRIDRGLGCCAYGRNRERGGQPKDQRSDEESERCALFAILLPP